MIQTKRVTRGAVIPLATGLGWLWTGASLGPFLFIYCLAPGILGIAAGVMVLDEPEEVRGREMASLAALIGVVFALPAFFLLGAGAGLLLCGLSVWSLLTTGSYTVSTLPLLDEVPEPLPDLPLAAKVAVDDALLGGIGLMIPLPGKSDAFRIAHEVAEAHELFDARGWFEKPLDYHCEPLPLDVPQLKTASVRTRRGSVSFEHMSFESEYEPFSDEPGRDRWLSYGANRMAHAWMMRHDDETRPWLIGIHGYQMGHPIVDFGLFDPHYLHETLGFNLLLPTLPLHGPRKMGRLSGDGFLSGDTIDTIHAESQAMWDIRRMIGWIQGRGASSVGAIGVSLGGYTVSLLAGLQPGLSGVIAGVPVSDFAGIFWDHGPAGSIRDFLLAGLEEADMRRILRVISPLTFACQVDHSRRAIFGGLGDRLVPAEQVRDLWRHWDRPEIAWYQGSHVSFVSERNVRQLVSSQLKVMRG